MNLSAAKEYLLSKPGATLDHPFGEDTMVIKVKHKMFATLSVGKMEKSEINLDNENTAWLNLKCDPDEALALRDIFNAVIPGYHMNKKHWNTLILDGTIPDEEIKRMIDNSFMLVVQNMPKADQESILIHL